ncbi:Protein kinase domain [Sesbania bispinosa]|nr:Protein kinase domain [Sesbania bispinosa]
MVVAVPLPDCLSFHHFALSRFTFYSPNHRRLLHLQAKATFITTSDSFQVGRPIGSYGFMNVTSFPSGPGTEFSYGDLGGLKTQDVEEGSVKIRLYEGRVSQGALRGTPVVLRRAGGVVADMMAANELNSHMFLQSSSKDISQHLISLVGGFETTTGEQWLAFRDGGKYSAADYAKVASERVSKDMSTWNRFEQGETIKRRQYFIVKLLQGAMRGLAYMHDHDRLHQSLGPFSVVLNSISEKEAPYLIPRLRDLAFSVNVRYSELEDSGPLADGLWARASGAGAYTYMEKKAFGIADDIYEAGLLFAYLAFVPFCEAGVMDGLSLQRLLENTFRLDLEATREYCIADDRLVNAVKFLDLGNGAGWELLQAMLNTDFRKRPTAEAVLNHRFMTGTVL